MIFYVFDVDLDIEPMEVIQIQVFLCGLLTVTAENLQMVWYPFSNKKSISIEVFWRLCAWHDWLVSNNE